MKGCQKSNPKWFCIVIFYASSPLVGLVTIGMGCDFWREGVVVLGIHAYK